MVELLFEVNMGKIKDHISTIIMLLLVVILYLYNNPRVDFNKDSDKGIRFYRGSWEEALVLAKSENKLIFLDVYATWCGPCKKLKKYVFSSEKAGNYFNSKFINITIDGERGEGAQLAFQYHVKSYPSLYIIDNEGYILAKNEGYQNTGRLIKWAKAVTAQFYDDKKK